MTALKDYQTCELVDELKDREGVEEIYAEPYVEREINVEGPARILIVTD